MVLASRDDGEFAPLTDPYGPYPADVATVTTRDGVVVPMVVRVESTVINRSITRVAVLDDPAAGDRMLPTPPAPVGTARCSTSSARAAAPATTRVRNSVQTVLGSSGTRRREHRRAARLTAARLAEGYAFVHSTLTILGVHCNQILSAETAMMVKEHVIEAYGPVEQVIGVGARAARCSSTRSSTATRASSTPASRSSASRTSSRRP